MPRIVVPEAVKLKLAKEVPYGVDVERFWDKVASIAEEITSKFNVDVLVAIDATTTRWRTYLDVLFKGCSGKNTWVHAYISSTLNLKSWDISFALLERTRFGRMYGRVYVQHEGRGMHASGDYKLVLDVIRKGEKALGGVTTMMERLDSWFIESVWPVFHFYPPCFYCLCSTILLRALLHA